MPLSVPGLQAVRTWRLTRRRKEAAIRRALAEFRARRGAIPVRGHVLLLAPHETVVRVMFFTDHRPPDRAWFSVSETDATVRELPFEDVAHLEGPWR